MQNEKGGFHVGARPSSAFADLVRPPTTAAAAVFARGRFPVSPAHEWPACTGTGVLMYLSLLARLLHHRGGALHASEPGEPHRGAHHQQRAAEGFENTLQADLAFGTRQRHHDLSPTPTCLYLLHPAPPTNLLDLEGQDFRSLYTFYVPKFEKCVCTFAITSSQLMSPCYLDLHLHTRRPVHVGIDELG